MKFQTVITRVLTISFVLAAVSAAFGQSTWVAQKPKAPQAVAGANNLYCAGYIQHDTMSTENRLIGGQDEADGWIFSQNDFMYINMGRDKGVNVGDIFAVVRPRGAIKSKWSPKGNLGFYVQELGALEVVRVRDTVSVVRVKTSCDNFLLGDLVQLVEKRTSPPVTAGMLDLFADPSGKANGRIVLARDAHEMIARHQIAYVDLGADDNVRIGDTLTIYRPLLERGNITRYPDRESVSSRDYGFESDVYKGGKFSNQSSRKTGESADGREIRTFDVRSSRPPLRKVVGEAVVLNVKELTATIVITRTAQEVHTGDRVEIK